MAEKEYEYKFNKIIIGITKFISNYEPRSFFGKHQDIIECFVEDKPSEPIAYFVQYVYANDEYRTRLKNMDDAFFLNQDFDEVDNTYMNQLFYFKDMWKSFDDDSKTLIKRSMKSLIKISEGYINALYESKINSKKKENIKTKSKRIKERKTVSNDEYSMDSISIGSKRKKKSNKTKQS